MRRIRTGEAFALHARDDLGCLVFARVLTHDGQLDGFQRRRVSCSFPSMKFTLSSAVPRILVSRGTKTPFGLAWGRETSIVMDSDDMAVALCHFFTCTSFGTRDKQHDAVYPMYCWYGYFSIPDCVLASPPVSSSILQGFFHDACLYAIGQLSSCKRARERIGVAVGGSRLIVKDRGDVQVKLFGTARRLGTTPELGVLTFRLLS